MNIYLDRFPELTKELNNIIKEEVNINLNMMESQYHYELIKLCEKWEKSIAFCSVGDASIGYETAARELREIVEDEKNSNF